MQQCRLVYAEAEDDLFIVVPALATLQGRLPLLAPSQAMRVFARLVEQVAAIHAEGMAHGNLSCHTVTLDEHDCPRLEPLLLDVVAHKEQIKLQQEQYPGFNCLGPELFFSVFYTQGEWQPSLIDDCWALAAIY